MRCDRLLSSVAFASLAIALNVPEACQGFTALPSKSSSFSSMVALHVKSQRTEDVDTTGGTFATVSRRSAVFKAASWVAGAALLSPQPSLAVEDDLTRQGIEVTPFNGLIFNYRGNDFNGLDASGLNEPSVPFKEFLQRLSAGDVEFVEFLAPDGDAAYATFKAGTGGSEEKQSRIRIGEGYPVEQHDGWSSPAFVIRSVKDKGVPYKFTVPALAAYK